MWEVMEESVQLEALLCVVISVVIVHNTIVYLHNYVCEDPSLVPWH